MRFTFLKTFQNRWIDESLLFLLQLPPLERKWNAKVLRQSFSFRVESADKRHVEMSETLVHLNHGE